MANSSRAAAASFTLLMDRPGWTAERYGAWLADTWARILLADQATG